jgi:hypothetical protein
MPIREVGRSGERKNPRGRRKKRKKARAGRLGVELKHHLGANNYGAKLAIAPTPCYLPGQRPRRQRGPDLGAKPFGAETCNLGATNDGAELRVQILKSYLQGHICEKLLKKGKKQKNRALERGRAWRRRRRLLRIRR